MGFVTAFLRNSKLQVLEIPNLKAFSSSVFSFNKISNSGKLRGRNCSGDFTFMKNVLDVWNSAYICHLSFKVHLLFVLISKTLGFHLGHACVIVSPMKLHIFL